MQYYRRFFLALFCLLPLQAQAAEQSIVLAGGCFWGVESVFEHVKGVSRAVAGYAGGTSPNPTYEQVSAGTTGYAEAVQVTFDPDAVTLAQLLDIYFTDAHDPTQANRQGPDSGTQYRSTIFYATPAQKQAAEAAMARHAKAVSGHIATTLEPLATFYPAEEHHQHYAALHPYDVYIIFNDAPKVTALKKDFPALYTAPETKSKS